MLAVCIRRRRVFDAVKDQLTVESFGDDCRDLALVWAATVEYVAAHGELPTSKQLLGEIMSRVKADPDAFDEDAVAQIREFVAEVHQTPWSELKSNHAQSLVRQLLRQHFREELRATLTNGWMPTDLGRDLGHWQEQLSRIEAIGLHTPVPGIDSIGFQTPEEFAAREKKREWLVKGILVRDQIAVIGGRKKTLKTSIAVDLAISIARGLPFLGEFDVPKPARVGFISGEMGEVEIEELALRILKSKEPLGGVADAGVHWSFRLPRLSCPEDLAALGRAIDRHKLEVVILDSLYLAMGLQDAALAANLFAMGPVLQQAANMCRQHGATLILIHHIRKGAGKGPPDLDDLAYSGTAEFARQWLLFSRREPFKLGSGLHRLRIEVGGSAGHSGCWAVDVDEGQMNIDFTGRRWAVTVRSDDEQRHLIHLGKESARQAKKDEEIGAACARILEVLARFPDGETGKHLQQAAGLSAGKVKEAIARLLGERRLETCKVRKKCGNSPRWLPAVRISTPEVDDDEVIDDEAEDDEPDDEEVDCPAPAVKPRRKSSKSIKKPRPSNARSAARMKKKTRGR